MCSGGSEVRGSRLGLRSGVGIEVGIGTGIGVGIGIGTRSEGWEVAVISYLVYIDDDDHDDEKKQLS